VSFRCYDHADLLRDSDAGIKKTAKKSFKVLAGLYGKPKGLFATQLNNILICTYKQGSILYFFVSRLPHPYMKRGSLKNIFVRSRPLTSPIRLAFLMMRKICGRS
jgi:hypothetical protein